MPDLRNHQSGDTTKMLFIGDSGAGKTGGLASLAAAGYNLRILDIDNGLDVLANILGDPKSQYGKDAIDRVKYVTITDPMKNSGGRLIPTRATVWQKSIELLQKWQVKEKQADGTFKIVEDLGSIADWTDQEVLVIDSLTMLSTAALNFILSLNQRLGQRPQLGDWGDGQVLVEGLLQQLYDEGVKCNVIVLCHITYVGPEGMERGYPNTLGKALPPKVGRYFNSILMAKTQGQGTALKRKILTNTSGVVELKNSAPTKVKAEYPLETGLADYFRDIRSH